MSYSQTFERITDRYYWQSALLIAQAGLSKQYRNSYLGALWLLFQPISMMCIYILIMPLVMKAHAGTYALYILSTLPLWQFMATTFITAPNALLEQADTLKRCMISSSIFPISQTLRHAYTYCIGFTVMLVVAWVAGLHITWHVFLAPVYFLPVLVGAVALSIGIAYIAPYVRDVGDAITILMNVMLWGSAVIYPLSALPEWAAEIIGWNPFYMALDPMVHLVYLHEIPSLLVTAKLLGVMGLGLALGYALYKVGRKNFVYYL